MANRDNPMGLRPLRNVNGDAPRVKLYPTTSAVIFEGELVQINSNGSVLGVTTTVAASSAVKNIVGVALHYKAASAATEEVLVHQDFGGELYMIQSDDNTITNVAGCVGSNFAVAGANLGSTVTGQSQCELDGNTASSASTASLILKCVEVSKQIGNSVSGGANVDLVVLINRKNLHYVAPAAV